MPVDTSIYGDLVKPADPLAQLSRFQAIQQMMNQNKLFQQEYQSKLAIGPILQSSIDPDTGQLNYDKFIVGLSQDPKTAYLAPQIANEAVQRQLTQAQTLTQQLEQASHLADLRARSVAPLVAKARSGKDLSQQDFISAASDFMRMTQSAGVNSPAVRDGVISLLAKLPSDPKQLAEVANNIQLQGLSAKDAADQIFGQLQSVDTGLGTKIIGASPRTGAVELANVPKLVEGVNPVTGAQEKSLYGDATVPGGTPAKQASIPTALGPLQNEMLKDVAKSKDDLDQSVNAAASMQQQLAEGAKLMDHFTPGGGSAFFARLGSIAQAMHMDPKVVDYVSTGKTPDGKQGDLGSVQAFNKLAVQWSTEIMRRLLEGGGRFTNLEFQKFQDSNPSADTDPRAIKDMFNFMSRMSKVLYAKQQSMNKYIRDPKKDPTQFEADWNKYLSDKGVVSYQEPFKEGK